MPGTIIVTGAAGGLGFAIAERLLNRPENSTYIFTVRNKNAINAKPLHDLIAKSAGDKNIVLAEIDLSCLKSVRAFAIDINAKVASGALPAIKVLILNAAAIFREGGRRFTKDENGGEGFEVHFTVNFLANVLLTLSLLESIDRENGRIVYISSSQHEAASQLKLSFDSKELAQPTQTCVANEGIKRYGISKLCLVMFMHALRRHLDMTTDIEKIRILGVDPGAMIHANILEKASSIERVFAPAVQMYSKIAVHLWPNGMFRSVQKSSTDVERAAFGEDSIVSGESKDVYLNGNELALSSKESMDITKQKLLWDLSLELVMLN